MTGPVLVATRSAHKLREIRQILGGVGGPEVIDLDAAGVHYLPEEEGIECYDTFHENALAKARYFAARSGMRTLADDSGLCVDALAGEPGVRSKRFSGRTDLAGDALDAANNQALIERLRGVPEGKRGAHYVCVVAIAEPGGAEVHFEGRCDGDILESPRGSQGFGYDPFFRAAEAGVSFGELDPELKNRISHRARAIRSAAQVLAADSLAG